MKEIDSTTPARVVLAELGSRLALIRKQRGLTQPELAEQAGLGVATLRRIEGGADSQLESWIKLLAALDMSSGINTLLPAKHRSPMADVKTAKQQRRQRRQAPVRWGDEQA